MTEPTLDRRRSARLSMAIGTALIAVMATSARAGIDGACCAQDGTCFVTSQTTCENVGGSYQGDGTTCATVSCSAIGACCQSNGSCSEDTESACDAIGGTWLGEDTDCVTEECDPVGACCLIDSSCVEDVTEMECLTLYDGFFQGGDSICFFAMCEDVGACCLPDDACEVATPQDCNVLGGVYQDDGVACAPDPCLPPLGACCLPGGQCFQASVAACDALGGIYSGHGIPCPACAPAGACCLPDATCEVRTEHYCTFDVEGVFIDVGTPCTPDPCPTSCPEDLDLDGTVGFGDLLLVLAVWGPCPACPEDLDLDGTVGFGDLLLVLAAWGDC